MKKAESLKRAGALLMAFGLIAIIILGILLSGGFSEESGLDIDDGARIFVILFIASPALLSSGATICCAGFICEAVWESKGNQNYLQQPFQVPQTEPLQTPIAFVSNDVPINNTPPANYEQPQKYDVIDVETDSQQKVCSHCNKVNSQNSKFCISCGKEL